MTDDQHRNRTPEPGMTMQSLNVKGFTYGCVHYDCTTSTYVAGINIEYDTYTHFDAIIVKAFRQEQAELLRQRLMALIADGEGIFNIQPDSST